MKDKKDKNKAPQTQPVPLPDDALADAVGGVTMPDTSLMNKLSTAYKKVPVLPAFPPSYGDGSDKP